MVRLAFVTIASLSELLAREADALGDFWAACSSVADARLGRAIASRDANEYVESLRSRGAEYAHAHVPLAKWAAIVRDEQRGLVAPLVAAYKTEPERLSRALAAMVDVMGLGVAIMTESYTAASVDERLRDANAFLDSIVENLPDMIFVKDARELRFERFNKAGEHLLGVPRSDLLGKNDYDFFPPDQAEFFQRKDRQVLAERSLVDIAEEPIETKLGQRWLHTKKIPILDDDGNPKWLLGISEDITERKAMMDRVRDLNAELETRVAERTAELRQSQKMDAVGRLAGGIAHDFNNLLSVILSYGELMAAEIPETDELYTELAEIRRAAQRAADLTRQLLAFSRQQVLAPKVTDLNQILVGMDGMLARLIGEHIEVRTIPTADISMILVDPNQIEQIIMNLVVNARDAMPKGGALVLETANVEFDQAYADTHEGVSPGQHVMIAVTDTGEGMDNATRARIFEPFFTTKETGKGTGLGLSTVFGIVKQSGGHIFVYSEIGKGTTFKIYFPRAQHVPKRSGSIAVSTPPHGSETILLVEDEAHVRELARTVLERQGYNVLAADGPTEALEIVARTPTIDLMLTDVVMPKMNGRELADKLRPIRPKMRVLYMSGYTDDAIFHFDVLAVGVAFIQKPITPNALARKVREVLDAPTEARARGG